MNPVVEAFALLTPYDIDKPKIRLGPKGDGGYVFVDDISPAQAIVSYGISTEYSFDAEMAAKGHDVYMFDHTIQGIVATSPRMHFFREGVAGANDAAASLYTIEDHLSRHRIEGDRLILKMDVEGAEFAALDAVPQEILERFEQIALEVHSLHRMENESYRERFCRVFRKLNRLFTLFHVHANNFDGPNGLHIVAGLPVSSLLELSYVKTSTVKPRPSQTLYPTSLDYPNVRKEDKLLWFFPFLPTCIAPGDFAQNEEIARKAARHAKKARIKLVNVARGKPATQSSMSQWSKTGEASRAVSGRMPKAFAFHTDVEDKPWWQVDLLDSYPIETIVVHNRLDMCQERAKTLVVEVSDDAQNWVLVHAGFAIFGGGGTGDPLELRLQSEVRGRYVRLSLAERTSLHLAQVEVYVRAETVTFVEFRSRHGLTNLRSRMEEPNGHSHHVYRIEYAADCESESAIIGLKLSFSGRFGNLLQQYTNMILLAERTGLRYIQLGRHELFEIFAPIRVGAMTFLPPNTPLPPDGLFLTGVFYRINEFSPVLKSSFERFEEDEQCRVVRDIIRPHLLGTIESRSSRPDPRELTVHIRSGDVFRVSARAQRLYRQPPLSFYKIVIDNLVKEGSVDHVRLVFEDRGNPCVTALEQHLAAEGIPFKAQSGTLREDLSVLVDAPHLVFGFGTFGYGVCRLSTRIETVHYFEPEHGGTYAAIPGIGRVFAVHDRLGKFIAPGQWFNTPEQRELMLTYPEEALQLEVRSSALVDCGA